MKILEGCQHRSEVSTDVILQPMTLKERSNLGRKVHELVLRHGREQVVFDLEVEISHPPVAQPAGGDVDGVDGAVLEPVSVLVLLSDGQMGVREGEVEEDVGAAGAGGEEVGEGSLTESGTHNFGGEVVQGVVASGEPEGLAEFALADDEAGMEDQLPGEGDEEASDRGEEECLHGEPDTGEGAVSDAVGDALVEGN